LTFSIVMPVKDEYDLLRRSLPACYNVRPDEVVLCFDKPAPAKCVELAQDMAAKRNSIKTRIIEVERNPEWRFHQAWVRRSGFRAAEHDRILTVDADLIINRNVLKAVDLAGKDDVGLVSCSKFYPIGGPLGFWRAVAYHLARRTHFAPFTGLYCIFRPFWLDSEDEGIKSLEDPRTERALGSLAAVGEDTYLRNCMITKHRVLYLREVGAYCMTRYVEDVPHMQFELGRYMAAKGYSWPRVLLRTLMYARIHYLRGYLYQKRMNEPIPVINPYTYSFSTRTETKQRQSPRAYWSDQVPMTFYDQPKRYEEKRTFRYSLQDYMPSFFGFERLKGNRVLEIGSGSGIDSAEMLRHGANVVSLDFSPLSCISTKNLLAEAGVSGQVVMADAGNLPFRKASFDAVYSFGVIHHIPEVSQALDEIGRCLRRNGLFMGMVYNRDSILYAYSLIYLHGIREGLLQNGLDEQEIASRFSERTDGNPYTKCYTREELASLLSTFFKVVEIRTFYNVVDTPEKRKVKFRLENGSEEYGWHLAFRVLNRWRL
jgi:ubiquinone/menaquinone biosynthesis C-methylase UbiE